MVVHTSFYLADSLIISSIIVQINSNNFVFLTYSFDFNTRLFFKHFKMAKTQETIAKIYFWNIISNKYHHKLFISNLKFFIIFFYLSIEMSLLVNYHLEIDWFSRYYPQTLRLQLVAVIGVWQQSWETLYTAPYRSKPLKIKTCFFRTFVVGKLKNLNWLKKVIEKIKINIIN